MALNDLLSKAVDLWGDRPFLLDGDSSASYCDFAARVHGCASLLADLGICPGDRVAVILPNGPEILYAWFALARLGAAMVPLNPALVPAEVEPLLRAVGARDLIGGAVAAELYGARLDLRTKVVVGGDGGPGTVAFAAPPRAEGPPARGAAREVATILQTSGTTGKAKAACLTHASYVLPALEFVRWMEVVPQDRLLGCLPLFHMAGQAFAAAAIAGGTSLVLVERFSAREFWQQVRRNRITVARHLGEMLAALCRQPERPDDREHSLRTVYGGGARREVAEEFERRFGAVVVEGYGLTETNTVLRNEVRERRPGSIGRPLPYSEVRVADEKGQPVPDFHPGEIQVRRGAVMMSGYVGAEDSACFVDDWFCTGDLGYRDDDGYFYFLSRLKDVIRRRGENVLPARIEEVLDRHPEVLLCAVVGVPDELGGEEIKAFLVCRKGSSIHVDDLVCWCRTALADFEVPRHFEICDALPRTPTNKINKSRLRLLRTVGGVCHDRKAVRHEAGEIYGAERLDPLEAQRAEPDLTPPAPA